MVHWLLFPGMHPAMSEEDQKSLARLHQDFESLKERLPKKNGKVDWLTKNWWQLICLLILLFGFYGAHKDQGAMILANRGRTDAAHQALSAALSVHDDKDYHHGMKGTPTSIAGIEIKLEHMQTQFDRMEKGFEELKKKLFP